MAREVTVDTSVVLAVVLNEPSKARLLELTQGAELLSPATLPWEVGNALSALFKRARLDLSQAERAVASYSQIAVRLVDVDLGSSVQLAHDRSICAYDAYVLECARRYGAPLLTLDAPQGEVARRLGITVLELAA
jgi:predicted nucleic acid-binding protein